jgi:thiamine pyrophosphate-dependent acetolactate synthase large subunit-like protein
MATRIEGHTGDLVLAALEPFGVEVVFTLNGGHVWPVYDAAIRRGIPIVDTRHEQTATWAAEAYAKLTRRPAVAVLTAGPGVTNGVSAVTSAHFNGSPLVVVGGRAPLSTWGSGALQELDHVPILAPVTKKAVTITSGDEALATISELAGVAATPHRGPVFADIPMDVLFRSASAEPAPTSVRTFDPDPDEVARFAAAIAGAARPAVVVGSDVYWAGAWEEMRAAAENLRVPCYANGMGRGCLPPHHDLFFSRTRGYLRKEADLVVVIGTPLDFRLGYGRFGSARVMHIADSDEGRPAHLPAAESLAGDLTAILRAMADWSGPVTDHETWIKSLREAEDATLAADQLLLAAPDRPIKPARIFGEIARRLEPDAVIICDGGDFASYAGKYLEPAQPGCWLDTGPYGCLGNGPGYAIAARLARPSSQVVAILGDGAAGFSLMDADSLVRHGLPVVMVVGNNGIWGLEKHPMRAIYGWDVACDLQPDTRYDQIVSALGGAGETVTDPEEVGPALDRGFASGVPYLINVMTDPADVYPRSGAAGI